MPNPAEQAASNLDRLRTAKPLIHNITNFVVMNFTANALLAMGASPVMAHAENEVEEMAGFASTLVLNIGTLSDDWVDSMVKAGMKAASRNIPIILDPVGAGATSLRTNAAKRIIGECGASIIRGNASEILALHDSGSTTRGVDALHSVDEAYETARMLAEELDATLAITGEVDLITDGERVVKVSNGHPLMPTVTGTGCAATAAIAAFAAVDADLVSAASTALAFYGLAGEKAALTATGPGSFATALIDALYTLTPHELLAGARIDATR